MERKTEDMPKGKCYNKEEIIKACLSARLIVLGLQSSLFFNSKLATIVTTLWTYGVG